MTISLFLLVAAFILFLLGAIPRVAQPFPFIAAGLACGTLSLLLEGFRL